jgi:hypothetical protein
VTYHIDTGKLVIELAQLMGEPAFANADAETRLYLIKLKTSIATAERLEALVERVDHLARLQDERHPFAADERDRRAGG